MVTKSNTTKQCVQNCSHKIIMEIYSTNQQGLIVIVTENGSKQRRAIPPLQQQNTVPPEKQAHRLSDINI